MPLVATALPLPGPERPARSVKVPPASVTIGTSAARSHSDHQHYTRTAVAGKRRQERKREPTIENRWASAAITVAAVGYVPPRPAPDLCWYWADPYGNRGYWDYC